MKLEKYEGLGNTFLLTNEGKALDKRKWMCYDRSTYGRGAFCHK